METNGSTNRHIQRFLNKENKTPGIISKTAFTHTAAFIDLLGTSALFQDFDQNAVQIIQAYRAIRSKFSRWSDVHKVSINNMLHKVRSVSMFSDSVIIFSPDTPDEHTQYEENAYLVYSIARAQYDLIINHDVFIRGGICSDKCLYSNDGIVASNAFVNAYKLESSIANFPIIVLPIDWVKAMTNHRIRDGYKEKDDVIYGNEYYFLRVTLNNTEYAFLHYLQYELMQVSIYPKEQDDRMLVLERHKDALIKAYNKVKNSSFKAAEKYMWLAHQYHNYVVNSEGMPTKLLIKNVEIPSSIGPSVRTF